MAVLLGAFPAVAWNPICTEIYNPHGMNVPPAGSTTLPGPKGGQNEDGFYLVFACLGSETTLGTCKNAGPVLIFDGCGDGPSGFQYDGNPATPAIDPFPAGTVVKYTEANGITPTQSLMGSNNGGGDGQAGAVDWHLWGNGDMQVCDAEDTFRCVCCYVPPPPK